MERYSCRMYLAHIPCEVFASLLNWINQSCPFASAAAHWPFQLSLLSTTTPRNLAISFEGILWLPRMSALLGMGTLLLGLSWCGISFLDRSSSWNFSMPKVQLCFVAQSKIPFRLFMMFLSLLWVSLKSFPTSVYRCVVDEK